MRIFTLLLILLSPAISQAQIWTEDFDGSNTTNMPTWTYQEYCTSRDYLEVVCIDGGGCTYEMNADYVYNSSSGQFLGVRDVDHNGCTGDPAGEEVTFTGIDISSCAFPNIVYLCFSVVESRNMNGPFGAEWGTSCGCEDTWDGNSSVQINANVDGAGYVPVTAIEALVGSDTRPGIDVNCDGDSGDSGEPELTDSFTEYCFELPALGSLLDLNIVLAGFNTAGEDVGIDNIKVHCEASPATLPPGATTLDACTPFTADNPCSLWLEDFEGGASPSLMTPCVIDDSRDYLGVVCLNGYGCPDEINSDYTYGNATGQFLGARDINGDPCGTDAPVTATATGINVSSCSAPNSLFLCFDIAESNTQPREGSDTWDGNQSNPNSNSFVTFNTTVDGSSTDIVSFAAIANNNSGPALDSDCDGVGEGTPLTPSFTTYCVSVPDLGANLDLSITIGGLNTDGDDVAIDNISVLCTNDLSCLPAPVTPTACTLPLAVSLSHFNGKNSNGNSLLTWETAQEFNNDYFEIQYSTDGRAFSEIGTVQGIGSSNSPTSYNFLHENVNSKENYYRLKQFDFNGEFKYSDIVYLRNEDSRTKSLIYPNPANSSLTFEGNASRLNFYDYTGSIVKTTVLDKQQGVSVIDISNLNTGFYMLEIIQNEQTQAVKKFIKN